MATIPSPPSGYELAYVPKTPPAVENAVTKVADCGPQTLLTLFIFITVILCLVSLVTIVYNKFFANPK